MIETRSNSEQPWQCVGSLGVMWKKMFAQQLRQRVLGGNMRLQARRGMAHCGAVDDLDDDLYQYCPNCRQDVIDKCLTSDIDNTMSPTCTAIVFLFGARTQSLVPCPQKKLRANTILLSTFRCRIEQSLSQMKNNGVYVYLR